MIYLIGALKNPRVPEVARSLRLAGFNTFDDWYSAGYEADVKWAEHAKLKGQDFVTALQSPHAQNVYMFDKRYLDEAHAAVLVQPAGKSAFLELGYMAGRGKPTFILLEGEPERFDVMFKFADGVHYDLDSLVKDLVLYGLQAELG